ncbi:MAG: GNAT family N-acetyltransferase [Deltaproteobacteria bacterium]|nr:GNAT family N-acetyltransferase [Deltaproteobacteria bacterium]
MAKTLTVIPRFLVATVRDEIVGSLPLFQVSSFIRGRRLLAAPVCRNLPILADDANTARKLVQSSIGLARATGCNTVEIRSGSPFPALPYFEKRYEFVNYSIDLNNGLDEVWSRFSTTSVKQRIRKAKREAIQVREIAGGDLSAYRSFHRLAIATRKKQGAPPLPMEFYSCLADLADQTNRSRLFLAERKGRILAAALVLIHNEIAHLFDAVSVTDKIELRHRPNHAVLWSAIKSAFNLGCRTFDLGPNHKLNQGLCNYKAHWGADAHEVTHYFIHIKGKKIRSAEIQAPTYKIAKNFLKNVPLSLYPFTWPLALEAY